MCNSLGIISTYFLSVFNRFRAFFTIVVIAFLVVSCSFPPLNKAQYLDSFEQFMDKVNRESVHWNQDQWHQADNKYKRLTRDYYDRFKSDLTNMEDSEITHWHVQYHSKRTFRKGKDLFRNLEDQFMDLTD